MAITNYHTVNGEIIGEATSAVRTGYLTDGLGSVTATQGSTGSALATYRYKPYGALLAKTGAGADPKFMYIGSQGYRRGSTATLPYIIARHLALTLGSWTTVDVLWPKELPYGYVSNSPTTKIDPTGMQGGVVGTTCINQYYRAHLHCRFRNMPTGQIIVKDFKFCDGDMGCDRCSEPIRGCFAEASAEARIKGTVTSNTVGLAGVKAFSTCSGVNAGASWLTAGFEKLFGTDVINMVLLALGGGSALKHWGIKGWNPSRTDLDCHLKMTAEFRVQWVNTCKPSGCDIPNCDKDACPMPILGIALVAAPIFLPGAWVRLCQGNVCAKRPKTCCRDYPKGLGGGGGGAGGGMGGGGGGGW